LGFLAFLATPAGAALVAAVPQLIGEVIQILHKSGHLTAQDIADHFSIKVPEIAEQPKAGP
jgi:hypothetical protein